MHGATCPTTVRLRYTHTPTSSVVSAPSEPFHPSLSFLWRSYTSALHFCYRSLTVRHLAFKERLVFINHIFSICYEISMCFECKIHYSQGTLNCQGYKKTAAGELPTAVSYGFRYDYLYCANSMSLAALSASFSFFFATARLDSTAAALPWRAAATARR